MLPGSPAAKAGLEPTDVIVAVDGRPVRTTPDLRRLISRHKPGEIVRLSVRAPKGLEELRASHGRRPAQPAAPVIGVLVDQASQVKLPFPVKIDAGSIGGPSAGLAFALDIVEELNHDITRGYKVAATGEINADGSVSPIGGVKQKIFGARQAGVDVFLVPAGDNAQVARKYQGDVRVIPVKSFQQALRALATLPPEALKTAAFSAVLIRPQRAGFSCRAPLIHGGRAPMIGSSFDAIREQQGGLLGKRTEVTCQDCYFHKAGSLRPAAGDAVPHVPARRRGGMLEPPLQPRLVPRPLSAFAREAAATRIAAMSTPEPPAPPEQPPGAPPRGRARRRRQPLLRGRRPPRSRRRTSRRPSSPGSTSRSGCC